MQFIDLPGKYIEGSACFRVGGAALSQLSWKTPFVNGEHLEKKYDSGNKFQVKTFPNIASIEKKVKFSLII